MRINFDVLIEAGKSLELATGIHFRIINRPNDTIIQLQSGNSKWIFSTEIKSTINTAVIGLFKQILPSYENTPILVAKYVTPAMTELLRASHINFLDAAGNAYINKPPLFINIAGNKPDELPHKTRRLYQSSGLKILFSFLCNPGLESGDYRKIASFSNVALGSVGWVMRDLKQSGHLVDLGKKGRKLTKKEELLNNWVTNYQEHLKPKLHIGRYESIDNKWWKTISMPKNTLWGSEYAATILTKFLKPENYSIYTDELHPEFLIKNKLHRTTNGNIDIFKKFWSFKNTWSEKNIVPPLLVYSDLIASQSDRNIETSKLIYENEITRLIK